VRQNLDLAKVTEEQKENEANLTVLTENIEKLQKTMEELKSKKSYLDYEFQDLTNRKALLQAELDKKQKDERDRIMPEIERLRDGLKYLKDEIEEIEKEIEKKNKQLELLDKHKVETETMFEKTKDEHEKLQEEYISTRQKPLNVGKMLQGDKNGMKIVDDELAKLRQHNEELKAKNTACEETRVVSFDITYKETSKVKRDSRKSEEGKLREDIEINTEIS
jgi:chromosome segregation ATPase